MSDTLQSPLTRIMQATSFTGVAIFIIWCIGDYITVKSPNYPENLREGSSEWILYSFMLGALVLMNCLIFIKQSVQPHKIVVALCSTIGSIILGVLLILFLGINFHFSIGGSL